MLQLRRPALGRKFRSKHTALPGPESGDVFLVPVLGPQIGLPGGDLLQRPHRRRPAVGQIGQGIRQLGARHLS